MPDLQRKSALSRHLWVIYLLSIILLGVIWYYQWVLGLLMTLFLIVSFYYSIQTEKTIINQTEEYIATLSRSEEHTSELQSRFDLVCRLLLEKKYIIKSQQLV